jgi:hypothetical protein
MSIFRVVFSNNIVISIREVPLDYPLEGEIFYYQDNARLIYAIIRAKDEEAVKQKAADLVLKLGKEKGR